jgi:hypothetical protein
MYCIYSKTHIKTLKKILHVPKNDVHKHDMLPHHFNEVFY